MMFRSTTLSALVLLGTVLAAEPAATAPAGEENAQLIIQTTGSLSSLRDRIESLGGRVTRSYDNLNAVAAELPLSARSRLPFDASVTRDVMVAAPGPLDPFDRRDDPGVGVLSTSMDDIPHLGATSITDVRQFAMNNPGAYAINHRADQVLKAHRRGITADNVVVAVVDSGLRPGFGHLRETTVVGCDNFISDGRECSDPANDGHGTMVSGLIAGAATYRFAPDSVFLNSVMVNAPDAALDLDGDGAPESVALIGSAPDARIFMFRAFVDSTTPTPSSVILAAVDQIIQRKREGYDIRVANLSLGRFTLYAGRSAFDIAFDALIRNGIVPVASAGNTGPALLTTAAPASSQSSIAVGAGSLASQERLAIDVNFCPVYILPAPGAAEFGFGCPPAPVLLPNGIGHFFRLFDGAQTAWFSSRGPNASGDTALDVVADGFVFGAGMGTTTEAVSLGSGTSFSAPDVAGIVALLGAANPGASAVQVRNAIVETGNPNVIRDGSSELDMGRGWVDVMRAHQHLTAGKVSDSLPPARWASARVRSNVAERPDARLRSGNVRERIADLGPGQRADILYEVELPYASVQITLSEVTVQNSPEGCFQNPVFGEDEIRVALHTAKTSAFPPSGFYFDANPNPKTPHAFISQSDLTNPAAHGILPGACGDGSCALTLDALEPGLIRVSLSGSTENGCRMSAQIAIDPTYRNLEPPTAFGGIRNGGMEAVTVESPDGVEELEFELSWENDWSSYPANDLDLLLFLPSDFAPCPGCGPLPILQTLDSPERFTLTAESFGQIWHGTGGPPVPIPSGSWTALVHGFEVNEASDRWELRVRVSRERPPLIRDDPTDEE